MIGSESWDVFIADKTRSLVGRQFFITAILRQLIIVAYQFLSTDYLVIIQLHRDSRREQNLDFLQRFPFGFGYHADREDESQNAENEEESERESETDFLH